MIFTSNSVLLGMAGLLKEEVKDVDTEQEEGTTTTEKTAQTQQQNTVQTEQKAEMPDFAALISSAVSEAIKPLNQKFTDLEAKVNQRAGATKPTLDDNQQDMNAGGEDLGKKYTAVKKEIYAATSPSGSKMFKTPSGRTAAQEWQINCISRL